MQQSFSLCIEKAREQEQGAGSAVLRWFNLQSITEVKSQLGMMHLLFGAPRWLCSREFKDMWLRSEMRKVKSPRRLREPRAREKATAASQKQKLTGSEPNGNHQGSARCCSSTPRRGTHCSRKS